LAERGFGAEQLREIGRIIDAEGSDVFDVLAYVGFSTPPVTRAERAETRGPAVLAGHEERLAAFLDFVLGQYVAHGVDELDDARLGDLLTLRYRTMHDARAELGEPGAIRQPSGGAAAAFPELSPRALTRRS
jgi:type I restriction enzyme R subunit